PDWLLGPAPLPGVPADPARLPRPWRRQAVLDIAHPGVHAYLLERLDDLVTEIGIAYLKWDHNRDLLEPLHPGTDGRRRPGVDEQQLAEWVALYKELRPLLHSGDVVRADHPDPQAWLHGVVSTDRRHAVFAYVRLATSPESAGGRLTLPGLDPALTYDVTARD